ncbi:MAG: polysaccharide biosynthesis protein, partial [Cyclobacteriaceae bacterium]|nr:polysaccharide biosynthesis protein [Cyclobacteriaceae bacterium]
PPVEKWVRGELSLRQIKEVRIEDLLGRNIIQLDRANIKREILGKRVCITGAAGSIGSEIVRQVEQFGPKEIILIDQAESPMYELERELLHEDQFIRMKFIVADVTNEGRMRKIFEETRPEILFHAAAYKHVPLMEANPFEAIYTNVFGTKIVADLCVEYKVRKFVFISTDKAVNPTNVMGASKRIAEIYIQSLNGKLQKEGNLITSFVTTRFGNVLGSNGSVIPFFTKQIAYGGPVTVTHPEIARYFMTIPEACQLVLEAGAMGKGGEIYIFDMGKAVKVVELAKKMIMLSGLEPGKDIEIVYTGLREGEKLYEELLNQAENTIPTHHSKIMIARVPEITYNEAAPFMEKLYEKLSMEDEMGLVTLMKEMVPEYISNYSRFEVIDKRNRLGKAS